MKESELCSWYSEEYISFDMHMGSNCVQRGFLFRGELHMDKIMDRYRAAVFFLLHKKFNQESFFVPLHSCSMILQLSSF